MNIPTVNEVKDAFHYQASDFNINREYPTKCQMQDVRRKIMKNLTRIDFDSENAKNYFWFFLIGKFVI